MSAVCDEDQPSAIEGCDEQTVSSSVIIQVATPTSSPSSQRRRSRRNAGRPKKFLESDNTVTTEKTETAMGNLSQEVEWDEDVPCSICQSMGEDNDLVNWIECSFCSDWFHGVCVGLQF